MDFLQRRRRAGRIRRSSQRKTSVILSGLLVAFSASVAAQVRPATEAEIELIRDKLILDEIPEWSHRKVFEVQGAFTASIGDRPPRLDGWVFLQPYLVQGSQCLMEASFISGIGSGSGYEWSVERFSYWNWPAVTGNDCEIEERSQVPGAAVLSSEPIPSSAMAYILFHSDELLTLAYDHVAAAPEIPEAARERMLAYRSNSTFRLERIELTEQSSPEFGFAYRATYRAAPELEGPSVVFSVTTAGFLVHGVGIWIA
jgi:hypothetical protein